MLARRVLHIGADSKGQALPAHFRGFTRVCFDINPRQDTDFVGDARNLSVIDDCSYDAAYLSRLLEFFHPWEIPQVLMEAARIVKLGGFVEARVPDGQAIFKAVVEGHPIDAPLYHTAEGPMTPQNLVHGRIGRTRNSATFMAHRTAFTLDYLKREFRGAGLRLELDGVSTEPPFHCFCIGRKFERELTDPIVELLESIVQSV